MRLAPLLVTLFSAGTLALAAERDPAVGPFVPTRAQLEEALVATADERDALRLSLAAATEEIARLRKVYDEQTADLKEAEADLTLALDRADSALGMVGTLDAMLERAQRAERIRRFVDRFGLGPHWGFVYDEGEFHAGPGASVFMRVWP